MKIWKPSNRRLRPSSKLEDCIYRDLSKGDESMEAIQQEAASKLHSFPALSRDIFQSFYSLFPKRTDAGRLTAEAQKFNAKLLDHVIEDADYPTIKSICEGRELPAYEAASEFTAKIGAQLDELLPELGGKDGTLKTLEKLPHGIRRSKNSPSFWSRCGSLCRTPRWNRR